MADSQSLLNSFAGKGKVKSLIKTPKVSRKMFRTLLKKGGKSGLSSTIPSRSQLKGV